jgi:hypothetical protein
MFQLATTPPHPHSLTHSQLSTGLRYACIYHSCIIHACTIACSTTDRSSSPDPFDGATGAARVLQYGCAESWRAYHGCDMMGKYPDSYSYSYGTCMWMRGGAVILVICAADELGEAVES